jgi:hypothetical protein
MRAATAVYRRGRVVADAYRATVNEFWEAIGRNNRGKQVLRAPASLGSPAAAPAVSSPAPHPGPAPDLAQNIAELGKLREDGVLTEDEFAAAKKRLLGG